MEFNILQHFKGLENMPKDPFNGDEIGTSLFLAGNMGPRISEKMDGYAKQAGMARRNFLKSSSGFLGCDAGGQRSHRHEVLRSRRSRSRRHRRQERSDPSRARRQRLHRRRSHARLYAAGPLCGRPEHHHARHVVRAVAGRSRQSHGPAQRHHGHDRRELRQVDSQGERHHRRHLQSVRLPRRLRRPGHDPDGVSGESARELAEVDAHAGRRSHAEPGPMPRRSIA